MEHNSIYDSLAKKKKNKKHNSNPNLIKPLTLNTSLPEVQGSGEQDQQHHGGWIQSAKPRLWDTLRTGDLASAVHESPLLTLRMSVPWVLDHVPTVTHYYHPNIFHLLDFAGVLKMRHTHNLDWRPRTHGEAWKLTSPQSPFFKKWPTLGPLDSNDSTAFTWVF